MLNERNKFFDKEILSGGIFFVFGLLMLFFIIPVTVPVSFVPPGQISPRFLPIIISTAITIIGFIVLLLAFLKRKKNMTAVSQTDKDVTSGEEISSFLKIAPVLSMLVVAGCFFLLIWAGFLVSSVFAMLAIMLVFGERRWWVLTLASIVVPASAWVFAVKLLKIPMP